MPPKGEPGSSPAEGEEEGAEEEEVDHHEEITRSAERQRNGEERHEERHRHRASEHDEGRGAEEPGGIARDHDLLGEELAELQIRLPRWRALAALQARLHPADGADQAGGEHQRHRRLHGREQPGTHRCPVTTSQPRRSTRRGDQVGEISMHRARLQGEHALRPEPDARDHGRVEVAFEPRQDGRVDTRWTARSSASPDGSRCSRPRSAGRTRRRCGAAARQTPSTCTPSAASGPRARSPTSRPPGAAGARRSASRQPTPRGRRGQGLPPRSPATSGPDRPESGG